MLAVGGLPAGMPFFMAPPAAVLSPRFVLSADMRPCFIPRRMLVESIRVVSLRVVSVRVVSERGWKEGAGEGVLGGGVGCCAASGAAPIVRAAASAAER